MSRDYTASIEERPWSCMVADISGQRFGRLVALSHEGSRNRHAIWLCRCDCGTEKIVYGQSLRRGLTVTCGCRLGLRVKHGHARRGRRDPMNAAWNGMRARCSNPRNPAWKHYGGRGIKVCERWSTYANFLADMGPRPPGLSIDRIDNDGDYALDNCCWATHSQQMKNRRPWNRKRNRSEK